MGYIVIFRDKYLAWFICFNPKMIIRYGVKKIDCNNSWQDKSDDDENGRNDRF
jgi:hypothetical protein